MKNQQQNQASKTNAQEVKKQNQASAQGFNAEFASETNAQEVKQQNAKSQARKQQSNQQNQQNK